MAVPLRPFPNLAGLIVGRPERIASAPAYVRDSDVRREGRAHPYSLSMRATWSCTFRQIRLAVALFVFPMWRRWSSDEFILGRHSEG